MKDDLTATRDMIKATITMDDVCDRLGIKIPHDRKIPSIYRKEKTPSLHLYKADFFDYATGQGGDVIRFVMDHQGWGYKKALTWLSRSSDGLVRTRHDQIEETVKADLTAYWDNLNPVELSYLGARALWDRHCHKKWGLSLDEVEDYGSKLVWHNQSTILATPHWDEGRVRGIKLRTLSGYKTSVKGSQYTHRLYGIPHRIAGGKIINACFIVEGESDVWALCHHLDDIDYDAAVYGLPSGANLWRDSWRNSLPGFVMLALDADEAGLDATNRIVGSLKTVGKTVYVLSPPGGRVAEAIIAGHPWSSWTAVRV